MDTALYLDLQRRILVRSLTDSRAYILPVWYAGETRGFTVHALLPTGDAGAPYAVQAITSLLLSLTYTVSNGRVTLASNDDFSPTVNGDGGMVGSLALDPAVDLATGVKYTDAILAIDLVLADSRPHIESGGTLKNPAYTITIPATPADLLTNADIGTGPGKIPRLDSTSKFPASVIPTTSASQMAAALTGATLSLAELILPSPNGQHWKLTMNNDGTPNYAHVATTYNVVLSATNAAGTGSGPLSFTVYH